MIANKYHEFDPSELAVLEYLKNMREYIPESFDNLIIFGAKAIEMIQFLEQPESYGESDFIFVCNLSKAVNKTYKKYVLLEFPKIEIQNEEDLLVSRLLKNDRYNSLLPPDFLTSMISTNHLILYLERNELIYSWNACLVISVKNEVLKTKKYLNFILNKTA